MKNKGPDPTNVERRRLRIEELNRMLGKPRNIPLDEYKNLLQEARHNYTVLLAIRSVEGKTSDTGAYIHVIEKAHYLLNTIEGKASTQIDVHHTILDETKKEMRDILGTPEVADEIIALERALIKHLSPDA